MAVPGVGHAESTDQNVVVLHVGQSDEPEIAQDRVIAEGIVSTAVNDNDAKFGNVVERMAVACWRCLATHLRLSH